MRHNRLIACVGICFLLLILLPLYSAKGQNYVVYDIAVNRDGSALWTIRQFSAANASVETWEGFQGRVFGLVDSAQSLTNRPMDIDEASLQINTTLSLESKTTEYSFVWRNFSDVQGGNLVFGDVFRAPGFFTQLFGDAALELVIPDGFTVQTVYPPPYERQDIKHTMQWARTQDLASNRVNIVLTPGNQNTSNAAGQTQYVAITVAALVVGSSVLSLGFYTFKRRRSNRKASTELENSSAIIIETEEEKVLRVLRNSGGTMRQSDITERLGFSKAKTSQLLSALESRGTLARYKNGRDKIVTLSEGRGTNGKR